LKVVVMKRVALILILAAAAGACHKSSTTAPSTTSDTTVAAPTETDTFDGVLAVGDTQFYKFTVGVYGTVNVEVTSIGGPGVPSTVETQLGIGTLSDTGCTTTITALAKPGVIGVTANENPGDYCATIHDVGNLFGPATYEMTVAHP
jgi:hypothetical protein